MQTTEEWYSTQGLTQYFEASFQKLVWFSKRDLAPSMFLLLPGAYNSTRNRDFMFHTNNKALAKEEKCLSSQKKTHSFMFTPPNIQKLDPGSCLWNCHHVLICILGLGYIHIQQCLKPNELLFHCYPVTFLCCSVSLNMSMLWML